MRKTAFVKTLCALFTFAILIVFSGTTVWADQEYTNSDNKNQAIICDDADFFSDSEEEDLLDKMKDITDYYNVCIYTTTSHSYSSTAELAENTLDYYFGYYADGIIFVIDRDLNQIYMYTQEKAHKDISSARCTTICDNVYYYATEKYGYDYYTCAYKAMEQAYILLDGGHIAAPMKYICSILFALAIALLINYFLAMFLSRSKKASETELLNGTFHNVLMQNANAQFLNQTKTYSPQSSGGGGSGGGGGGGGGHSGGGGGHSI